MSVETAEKVSKFIVSNSISRCTLTGGEFFCNPNWRDIFDLIIPKVKICRLITNGDWGIDSSIPKFLSRYRDNLYVSISDDNWHDKTNIKLAKELCTLHQINWNVPTDEMKSENTLVPLGRLKYEVTSIYGMFGAYCHNPERMYGFLIDENGLIYKCAFGIWEYTNVEDHLTGRFAETFKEFNKKFYKAFIPNCSVCYRAYKR